MEFEIKLAGGRHRLEFPHGRRRELERTRVQPTRHPGRRRGQILPRETLRHSSPRGLGIKKKKSSIYIWVISITIGAIFEIQFESLVVSADEPFWSINMKKAVASKLQLHVSGSRSVESASRNFGLPTEDSYDDVNSVFKVFEVIGSLRRIYVCTF